MSPAATFFAGLGLLILFGWYFATDFGLHIVYYVILLHYQHGDTNPERGATFSNILGICQARKQCGARAVRTVLALTQLSGHITVSRAAGDQRVTIYAPAPKLVKLVRQQFAHTLACLDIVMGEDVYAKMMRDDDSFLPYVMATAGRKYIDLNIGVTDALPALHNLLALKGACPTVAMLADAQLRGAAFPSPHAIARAFKISASQARNVFKAAQASALLSLNPNEGVTDARELARLFKTMVSRELALYAKYSLDLEASLLAKHGSPTPQTLSI